MAGRDENPVRIAIDRPVGRIVVHLAAVPVPTAAFVNRSPLTEA